MPKAASTESCTSTESPATWITLPTTPSGEMTGMCGRMLREPRSRTTRVTRKNSVKSLPTTCAADGVAGERLAELEETAQLLVVDLLLLEPVHVLAKAHVVVAELLVVRLHVVQVNVVAPDVRDPAGHARRAELDGGADPEDHAVERVQVLWPPHVGAQEEERNGEQQDDDGGVTVALEGGHLRHPRAVSIGRRLVPRGLLRKAGSPR